MIELDFAEIRALRIAGRDVAELRRGAVLMWAKPPEFSLASGSGYAGSVYAASQPGGQWFADGVPIFGATAQTWIMADAYEGAAIQYDLALSQQSVEISITSGAGFAGSVYSASRGGGQWYADGLPIPGARGQTYTLAIQYEGAAISYITFTPPRSNVIQMMMPTDLPTALKEGWWDPKRGVQVTAGDAISAVPDGFELRDLVQGTAANQPMRKLVGNVPVISFPVDTGITYFSPTSALRAAYVFAVAQYGTGLESLTGNGATLLGDGTNQRRMRIPAGSAAWQGVSERRNGVPASTAALPMPKALLSAVPFANGDRLALWSLGWGQGNNWSWLGDVYEVLALASEPDDATRLMIEGCLAHRNGLAAQLPADHRYKTLGPRIL
ncbi:hypothetical protein [Ketogulonicigenium vulgare]|uniref:hypothetical protein n=1 Tax=Ketogulonicigenium vulgare TaxID=92945 RepID=UPI0023585D16|nr:hypothetical protein [Ketogulonicigenium vulgare]